MKHSTCSYFPGEKVTSTIPVSNFCFFFLSSLSWLISRWPTGKAVMLILEAETALLMLWDLGFLNFSVLLGKDLFRTKSKYLIMKQLHYILENTVIWGTNSSAGRGGIVLAPLLPEPGVRTLTSNRTIPSSSQGKLQPHGHYPQENTLVPVPPVPKVALGEARLSCWQYSSLYRTFIYYQHWSRC